MKHIGNESEIISQRESVTRFLLLVFLWISFPPEYPIRTVSNFFENSRRYSQVMVHHRYQRHRWEICHRYCTIIIESKNYTSPAPINVKEPGQQHKCCGTKSASFLKTLDPDPPQSEKVGFGSATLKNTAELNSGEDKKYCKGEERNLFLKCA
jgi:hypothetical protein